MLRKIPYMAGPDMYRCTTAGIVHYWRVGVDVGSEFGRQLRRWNIDAAAWRRRFF